MPSEKYIIFANETTPRSSHESPCASARGQTRIPMTSISSNTQTHGFQCLESFFPQALIHPASKKEVVYSETKRRRARTKRQARTHIRKAAKVEKALSYKLWRSCPRERSSAPRKEKMYLAPWMVKTKAPVLYAPNNTRASVSPVASPVCNHDPNPRCSCGSKNVNYINMRTRPQTRQLCASGFLIAYQTSHM